MKKTVSGSIMQQAAALLHKIRIRLAWNSQVSYLHYRLVKCIIYSFNVSLDTKNSSMFQNRDVLVSRSPEFQGHALAFLYLWNAASIIIDVRL